MPPLLTVRAALIFFLAAATGAAAGGLTFLGLRSLPHAALVGSGAFAGAVVFFNKIIGP